MPKVSSSRYGRGARRDRFVCVGCGLRRPRHRWHAGDRCTWCVRPDADGLLRPGKRHRGRSAPRRTRLRLALVAAVGECYWCGEAQDDADVATLDHLVPRARGGGHHRENQVLCCAPCNQAKGDLLPCELDLGGAEVTPGTDATVWLALPGLPLGVAVEAARRAGAAVAHGQVHAWSAARWTEYEAAAR